MDIVAASPVTKALECLATSDISADSDAQNESRRAGYAGLDRAGPGRAELGWAGLGWAGLGQVGGWVPGWVRLGTGRNGTGRSGEGRRKTFLRVTRDCHARHRHGATRDARHHTPPVHTESGRGGRAAWRAWFPEMMGAVERRSGRGGGGGEVRDQYLRRGCGSWCDPVKLISDGMLS